MNKVKLAKEFEVFAADCVNSSPLYELLALKIAMDDELLELTTFTKQGQPVPNMLFGAVHHLLLNGVDDQLGKFYQSIVRIPREPQHSFQYFKSFCQQYREEIIDLLQVKLVQTNEVRRCAYLYPSFAYIYKQTKQPLALIEIGTSAGFQLLWDTYSYSYQSDEVYGNKNTKLHLTAEIKGTNQPYLPKTSPPVSHRIGLDLHINDLSSRENYLWLLSLIWPEHEERRRQFKQAAQSVSEQDLCLIEGDGVQLLPQIVKDIPKDSTLCIFHTHVANQFSNETKHDLIEKITQIGASRDVFHLYNNMWDGDLHLDAFVAGEETKELVGKTNSHGKWFSWNLH